MNANPTTYGLSLKGLHPATLLVVGLVFFMGCKPDEVEPVPEPQTTLSGGENFTTFDVGKNAFGIQGTALTREESRLFVSGNSLFRTNWVEAPSSVMSLDGLGPVMNASSCGSCHFKDGRAAPPDEFPIRKPGLLFRLSTPGATTPTGHPAPHTVYGNQLQDRSLPDIEREGEVVITYEPVIGAYVDGVRYELQRPIYSFENLRYGPLTDFKFSPRIAVQMVGLGLLEAIPISEILAGVDPEDADGDGISGRANVVWNVKDQTYTTGRFGWKASEPDIMQQNAGAFRADMGLTNSLFPSTDFTEPQRERYPNIINGGSPEISDEQLERVRLYVRALGVPQRRNVDDPAFARGNLLFNDLGCASCHRPTYQTGSGNSIASLNNQTIYPYTDLLLHDMGNELADGRPDFEATGSEWRTPPLWGVGLVKTVNGHTRFLHDGRARSLEEAILWHGGEALSAQQAFTQLSASERADLLQFIESI